MNDNWNDVDYNSTRWLLCSNRTERGSSGASVLWVTVYSISYHLNFICRTSKRKPFHWRVCFLQYSDPVSTAMHWMQGGLVRRKLSVCPSVEFVRPSVRKTTGLWQNGRKIGQNTVQISFSLVFWEKEWLMGRPLLPEILGQPAPVGTKSPSLNRYSLVAPQP